VNSALPSPSQPPRPRVHAQDGIEWEELPSLRDRVIPEGWADTMPASLEALLPSPWLRDLLPGLDVHEIDEPEIFRVYFEKRA
jgi:hypothetical protein